MADGFSVSPAGIMRESERFRDLADTADRIRKDLETRLNGLGPIAGADKYGKQFSAQFDGPVKQTGEVLEGVRDGAVQTTGDLQITAALYAKSNEVNTDLGMHLGR